MECLYILLLFALLFGMEIHQDDAKVMVTGQYWNDDVTNSLFSNIENFYETNMVFVYDNEQLSYFWKYYSRFSLSSFINPIR